MLQKHKDLVQAVIEESKDEGIDDRQIPYEVSQFLRSLYVQTKDESLLEMAKNPAGIQELISELT
ncbi:MAG TPA: hypothetical protein V6C57_24145 [Coleofasciculaceae cyanobacterium]